MVSRGPPSEDLSDSRGATCALVPREAVTGLSCEAPQEQWLIFGRRAVFLAGRSRRNRRHTQLTDYGHGRRSDPQVGHGWRAARARRSGLPCFENFDAATHVRYGWKVFATASAVAGGSVDD